jgi:hypothetical protein
VDANAKADVPEIQYRKAKRRDISIPVLVIEDKGRIVVASQSI